MPVRAAVVLPLPRVVVGVRRRARAAGADRLPVIDAVPVEVERVAPGEAPVVLRLARPGDPLDGRVWRGRPGALYRPLFAPERGCSPAEAAAVLADRAGMPFWKGGNGPYAKLGEEVIPYADAYRNIDRRREPRTFEGHAIAEVTDDGTAARDALARAVAADLLLVGDELWHRAPAPGIRLSFGGVPWRMDGPASPASLGADTPYARSAGIFGSMVQGKPGSDWAWFPPDAVEDALAFRSRLLARDWCNANAAGDGASPYEVLDPAGLSAAVSAPEAATRAAAMGAAWLSGLGRGLAGCDPGVDEARMAVLAAASGRSDPDAFEDALAGFVEILSREARGAGPQSPIPRLLHQGRCLLARDEFRAGREAGAGPDPDLTALGGMAP